MATQTKDEDATFDAVNRKQAQRSNCPVCGQPSAGQVQITIAKYNDAVNPDDPKKPPKGGRYKNVHSRSKVLCEKHTVLLYHLMTETMEDFLATYKD